MRKIRLRSRSNFPRRNIFRFRNLEACHSAFYGAGSPGQAEPGGNGVLVASESRRRVSAAQEGHRHGHSSTRCPDRGR